MAALLISVLINALLLAAVSYQVIQSEIARKNKILPPPPEEFITLSPDMFELNPETGNKETAKPKAVRTSEDQESAEPPASRRFIGERNTRATSDRVASGDDPEMPSQFGREARPGEQPETTESKYQDGRLDSPNPNTSLGQPTPPTEVTPTPLTPTPLDLKGHTTPDPGSDEVSQTAVREKLLEGPNPIETAGAKAEREDSIKPREEKKIRDGQPDGLAVKKPSEQPKTTAKPSNSAVNDPAFSGNQSKTAIRGSISRTGRSALDVADTPMGRYQAKISRAVELEWQRNCVRRRDFIVPGYLTARFFLNAKGRVTSVEFIGDIEGGAIQKGFTLDAIRDAAIPPMPPAVKQEMEGDSLELIFNFYF